MFHLLANVSEESTFVVWAGPGLIAWTLLILTTWVASGVTAVTRQWDLLVMGIFTLGLAWYVGLYRALRRRMRPVRWVREAPSGSPHA